MNLLRAEDRFGFGVACVLIAALASACDVTIKTGPLSDGPTGGGFLGSGGLAAAGGRGGSVPVGNGGAVGNGGRGGGGGITPDAAVDANMISADLRADAPPVDGPVIRDVAIVDGPTDAFLAIRDVAPGADAAPATKAACDKLETEFALALVTASRCNPAAANQCQKPILSGSVRCTFCQIFVEDDVAAKALRDRWKSMGCEIFYITPCPVASCVASMPGKCRPVDAGPGGVCSEF